jgi:hypothetical protein
MHPVKVRYLLLGLPLLIYLAMPSRNFYWDGVAFAINIEKQLPYTDLFHPSHLIYAVTGRWLYRALNFLGLHTRALYALQAANSILAAASIVLVHKILRLRDFSPHASIVGALLFAFSATWWKFATDADAYIPSIFLLLCAYCILETYGNAMTAGFAIGAAMLFHELAIFFLPVAILRLKGPRNRLVCAAFAIIPAAIVYGLAYWAIAGAFHVHDFLVWITSHSPDSGFSFQPIHDFVLTIRGTLRLLLGGRITDVVPGLPSALAVAAMGAVLVALAVHLWRVPKWKLAHPPKDVLLWLGIYVAFLFFWMPQNTFYRLFYLAPLVVVLGCAMRAMPIDRAIPRLAVSLLALWNFVFLVYPQSRIESNPPLRFALDQNRRWPAGTPIVFHQFHPDLWTISYFNQQAAWIGLDHVDLAQLDRDLAYAHRQNQPLWMEATAWDLLAADPAGREWLVSHAAPQGTLVYKDSGREFRFYQLR